MRAAILSLAVAGAALADDPPETVVAPSGLGVVLHDVLYEEHPFSGETLIVVRLVAPGIASPVFAANLQADMEWACNEWGVPAGETLLSPPDQIIVELMEAAVPRGQPSPDVTRFFETYGVDGNACIWELF